MIDTATTVVSLKSQFAAGLIGLPGEPLLLSWAVESTDAQSQQLGYEIELAANADFAGDVLRASAEGAESQWVAAPAFEATSRATWFARVRVRTQAGLTAWSPTLVHELGLLNASDWAGVAIGDEGLADEPAALLRTKFNLTKPVLKARVYATAHGVFDLMINGQKVGDHILAPGWTSYQERVLAETHDVTAMLTQGENAFGALLGDGWYRGKFGFQNLYNNYGNHTSLLAQLEIEYTDGTTEVIATGERFKTATGGVRLASIYDGCTLDFTKAQPAWCKPGFDDSAWVSPTIREFDKSQISPLTAPPVRVKAELPMTIKKQADRSLLNAGQNISGWVRLTVNGKRGDVVTVRHAEILEPGEKLHTVALRSAKATDTYTLGKDGETTLEPKLTFHGFQYADVVTEAEVVSAVAIAITSDTPERGTFESAHPLLNKLHSNVLWSLRDNFVSIPTDCPQRDERMGWTGDAQAFVYAASTLVDAHAFLNSWLTDLAIDQRDSGQVPHVVPDLLAIAAKIIPSEFPDQGEAGWGDAAVVVPWSQYQMYGDKQILQRQLQSMRGWIDYCETQKVGSLIPPRMQLGDWLDPDAPDGQPWAAKVSGQYVANSYIVHSATILADIEALLGNTASEAKYRKIATDTAAATWAELGEAAITTPTGCAMALIFNVAPKSEHARISSALAKLVRDTDGRISTGFLGTPIILDALSQFGNVSEAYLMLLREQMPSWLYPITVGATTIWERWNAIHPDGSINGGGLENPAEGSGDGMISFNHYAYGAVIDWVYRNLAGLTATGAGYQQVSFAPKLVDGITYAKAAIETGYGKYAVDYRFTKEQFEATLDVPFGVTATLQLPINADSVITIDGKPAQNQSALTHGTYQIVVTNPAFATV